VPRHAKSGNSITAQVSFGVETFQTTPEPIELRVALRGPAGEDGQPRLLERGSQRVTPMDPRPYAFDLELPDSTPDQGWTVVFYASRDGTFAQPYVAGEARIDLTPDE
jgi:hypothetical protein